MRNKTIRLTQLAIAVTVAIVLSYIESQIPAFVAIPGVKVGLANIAVIFMLYKFGGKEAIVVSLVRIILISILFGQAVSFFYSISGAVLSFIVMLLIKKLTPLSEVVVSVVGGIMHNVGQIIAASILLETNVVVYYLPFLLVSGTVAGIVVGVVSAILIKKIKIEKI